MKFENTIEFSKGLDEADNLKSFRDKFHIPEKNTIYLDGNSLGRLPKITLNRMMHHIEHKWGERLIRSWNEGWYDLSSRLGAKIAKLIGAKESEVIAGDSTSLNLYKLAYAAIRSQHGRTRIISDDMNFPTDLYVLQGIINQSENKHELILARSQDGIAVSSDNLKTHIDTNTALVVLSHVAFKSAFMYDMKAITKLAHERGALILWDLSHAAGAVPVNLNEAGVDLAIGCTYKYLNGGPGSPAFLYVNETLQDRLTSPLWGWFGDADPFAFDLDFRQAKGIRKFLVGTPPVLSMDAIEPGLDLLLAAGMEKVREKSIHQTEYLLYLVRTILLPLGFSIGSPEDHNIRGSHVSIKHPEGYRICKALIQPFNQPTIVIPDFREPDNIRIGITPLYTSFEEIFLAVERMETIVKNKEYEAYSSDREDVT